MKRLFLVIVVTLVSLGTVFAQEKRANRWEVGVGYAFQLGGSDGGVNMINNQSIPAYLEWRHLAGEHWDIGARLDTDYGLAKQDKYKGLVVFAGLLGVVDFNFLPGKKVNPFIGFCAGPGLGSINVGYSYVQFLFNAGPRVGLEIVDHVRISAGFEVSLPRFDPLFMPAYLTLGWTF